MWGRFKKGTDSCSELIDLGVGPKDFREGGYKRPFRTHGTDSMTQIILTGCHLVARLSFIGFR